LIVVYDFGIILLISPSDGSIISAKSYNLGTYTSTKFVLINSMGDAAYLLDNLLSSNLFKFDPSTVSISGNLINY
jgi:hypothetical protein